MWVIQQTRHTEDRSSEAEDRSEGIMQNEEQRKKKGNMKERFERHGQQERACISYI